MSAKIGLTIMGMGTLVALSACKREDKSLEGLEAVASVTDSKDLVSDPNSGNTEGFVPQTTTGPETTSQEPNYVENGVEYTLVKGYQETGCEQFKGFQKEPKAFQVKHDLLSLATEDGTFVRSKMCGVSAKLMLPKNHIVNFTFPSQPVSSEMLLQDGDSFSFTFDLLSVVNGADYRRKYVATLKGPFDGIKDTGLDMRAVKEMSCAEAAPEDREVNFSMIVEAMIYPKQNSTAEDKLALGHILQIPKVNIELKKCDP